MKKLLGIVVLGLLKSYPIDYGTTRAILEHEEIDKKITYGRIYKMKKLSSKKKILQIRMLNKNIQKIKLRKNKRVKDEKKAADRKRMLPRNR